MTELPVNQKEYLKKYLGIGKAPGEKKRKKKKPGTVNRVQIIDDDADVNIPSVTIEDDVNEDAPQIVAIIDERPPSLRVDEKTQNPLWRPIGTVDDVNPSGQKQTITGFKIAPKTTEKILQSDRSPPRRKKVVSNDRTPPRKSRFDDSPPKEIVIKQERRSEPRFGDNSPPRRNRDDDVSPPRRIKIEDDGSPPRRRKGDSDGNKSQTSNDASPPRRRRFEDNSPPRRRKGDPDGNKSQISNDASPPRRRKYEDNSPPRRRKEGSDRSRSQISDDNSPPRRRRREDGNTPPRRGRKETKYDRSPPRRGRENVADRSRSQSTHAGDNSPPRKPKTDEKRSKKMDKTLDGKSAGLQNARELIEETRNFKNREDTMFKSLSKDVSGEQAETVHRDRRTGKIRNLEEEEERKRKKQEEEEKNKEKYARWGRGLAQVESREQKLQEQLHEMSKPLARYADDEDLERYLKEKERDGDPMLAYIRKKKRKKAADAGEVIKPQFEGEFMPNRYGIRPGHRWDGVDRSNGYEKKWFEVQNQKTALLEDSYKWSTEDM